MFDRDKWTEILISVGRHKLRTVLTAFGISWGIFMLVILLGVGNGLQNGVENMFKDDALNAIWFYPGKASHFGRGFLNNRSVEFRSEHADYAKELEAVERMSGRFYLRSSEPVVYKDESMTFNIRSVHPDHQFIENTIMTEGRYLNELDIQQCRKTACIGRAVRDGLFKDEDPMGKYISIGNVAYKVVGIFKDEGSEREEQIIYIPITTAQKIYAGNDRIDQFMVTSNVNSLEAVAKLEGEVVDYLSRKLNFDPKDENAVSSWNSFESYQSLQGLFSAIDIFIWFVGLGSIFAGIIGISNIMLIVVADRKVEIGLRKALGATNRDIIQMILHESVFITALAGFLGLAFGVFVLYLMEMATSGAGANNFMFRNPEVRFGIIFSALLVLVLSGALAGILPARKAIHIQPAEAMRK
jgi:putative ABC transport system permease protein